ncbi:MAG TPA: GMC family oxidoreductase [Woeseiaceae bacterium]|nr:GMC family oxidoreductase [Woeseiaceae bacterium]
MVKHRSADVVLVGFGQSASLLAQELTETGLEVLALERGGPRRTSEEFAIPWVQDELRFAIRNELFEQPHRTTVSFRHNARQRSLPMRHLGSFNPGTGVGGAAVHWNGQHWRFLPHDFELRSRTVEQYGAGFIPDDMTIQDWGVTYAELEPWYDKFDYICGVSGQAGNLRGEIQAGGNPFEGPRSRPYPLPPLKRDLLSTMFDRAAIEVGDHPFPGPASNTSKPYKNAYGVQMGACTYCGFCEWHGCGNYSKASPQTTILPVLLEKPNFACRTHAAVTRINLDSTGTRAVSVNYVDMQGEEHEQPGDLIIVSAYATHNVHLLLVSGIGRPYDPRSGKGVVGRNYAYQTVSSVDVFTHENLNPFMGAGALGQIVDDYNSGNFDHGRHGFIGGGYIASWTTGQRPIGQMVIPHDAPGWGSGWKRAAKENYLRGTSLATHGSSMAYRDAYLDLDPAYRDVYGNPLLRVTFDFHENDLKMSDFLTRQLTAIARAMKPRAYHANPVARHYSIVPYQTTHNTGGAIMGNDPETSVVNRYLQCWDVPNLFVVGASAFPQNAGYNPNGTVGALSLWAADAIRSRYLKSPGPLVQA